MTLRVLEADHHGREHDHDHPPRKTEVAKADSGGAGSGTSPGAHLGTLPVSEADRTMDDAGPSATATVKVPLLREPERVRDASTMDGENGDWCTAGWGRGRGHGGRTSAGVEDRGSS